MHCHAPLLLQLITVVYTNILQTVNQQLNLIIYLIAPFSVIRQPHTTHEPMFRLTTAPATPLTTAPPRARPAAPGVLSCHYPTLPLTQPLQPINTHNLTHSVITIVLSPGQVRVQAGGGHPDGAQARPAAPARAVSAGQPGDLPQ